MVREQTSRRRILKGLGEMSFVGDFTRGTMPAVFTADVIGDDSGLFGGLATRSLLVSSVRLSRWFSTTARPGGTLYEETGGGHSAVLL